MRRNLNIGEEASKEPAPVLICPNWAARSGEEGAGDCHESDTL